MKLDDIFTLWNVDANIDRTELGDEALKIPKLHAKYYAIFTEERLRLRKYETDLKRLRLDKYEFYTQGPTQETHDLGWKLPAIGKVIKSDAYTYVDADSDIIDLTLKIGIQQEKIELLDSIIRTLTNRGYLLKTAVDWEKFKVGI